MSQLGLFNGPMVTPEMRRTERIAEKAAARKSIDQRFAEFWTANPIVWDGLKELAFKRLKEGAKRIGVKALWEELRAKLSKRELAYDADLQTPFKLNNDFTALYARKLIQNHPELAAVIEVRKRKGEP